MHAYLSKVYLSYITFVITTVLEKIQLNRFCVCTDVYALGLIMTFSTVMLETVRTNPRTRFSSFPAAASELEDNYAKACAVHHALHKMSTFRPFQLLHYRLTSAPLLRLQFREMRQVPTQLSVNTLYCQMIRTCAKGSSCRCADAINKERRNVHNKERKDEIKRKTTLNKKEKSKSSKTLSEVSTRTSSCCDLTVDLR